jgi:hypothetical protein
MSTPESTVETPELGTSASERQDELTNSIGTSLAPPSADDKASWWKRLLGRG